MYLQRSGKSFFMNSTYFGVDLKFELIYTAAV